MEPLTRVKVGHFTYNTKGQGVYSLSKQIPTDRGFVIEYGNGQIESSPYYANETLKKGSHANISTTNGYVIDPVEDSTLYVYVPLSQLQKSASPKSSSKKQKRKIRSPSSGSNPSSRKRAVRRTTSVKSRQSSSQKRGGARAPTYAYKGKQYTVRVGVRGGKYILVKGNKVYV